MPRERDESGKYTDSYTDADFLNAIREHDGLAGTTEVAEAVGCTRRHALNRLRDLESAGRIKSRDVGRALVWMLADEPEKTGERDG